MFKQIIIGLLVAGVGGVIVYFSNQIAESFGRISRFENNLGSTRNGHILLGFGLMVIGLLILFGIIPTTNPAMNVQGFPTDSTTITK